MARSLHCSPATQRTLHRCVTLAYTHTHTRTRHWLFCQAICHVRYWATILRTSVRQLACYSIICCPVMCHAIICHVVSAYTSSHVVKCHFVMVSYIHNTAPFGDAILCTHSDIWLLVSSLPHISHTCAIALYMWRCSAVYVGIMFCV